MGVHNTSFAIDTSSVLEVQTETVRPARSELEAQRQMALLVAVGFARTPAALVAPALGRGPSSTYALAHPGGVSGLRAHELLLAPRGFATSVLRGMLASVEGHRCGFPSQESFVLALSGVVALCAATIKENPDDLSDELLSQRLREFDQAASDLEINRRRYEEAARRRSLRRGMKKKGGGK